MWRAAKIKYPCVSYAVNGRPAYPQCLKDAGAARVTAVVPYLCYAGKDRRTKANDPVTTRYVAGMFESVGTDSIVTLEVHNPVAFENAFHCRTVTRRCSSTMPGH